jgi:uncharacterized protein (TIGR03086 family)
LRVAEALSLAALTVASYDHEMTTTDPIALLSRALDQAAIALDGAGQADPSGPTPCREWTLGELIDHVVFDTSQFTNAATGGTADWKLKPPHIDAGHGAAFRDGAGGLVEAWRGSGDVNRVISLPIGERPASFVITQQTAEFAVHAWDVAQATGQQIDWDDEVALAALAWSTSTLLPAFRGDGKPFGPEVPVASDAAPQDRLVGWFGRTPR